MFLMLLNGYSRPVNQMTCLHRVEIIFTAPIHQQDCGTVLVHYPQSCQTGPGLEFTSSAKARSCSNLAAAGYCPWPPSPPNTCEGRGGGRESHQRAIKSDRIFLLNTSCMGIGQNRISEIQHIKYSAQFQSARVLLLPSSVPVGKFS